MGTWCVGVRSSFTLADLENIGMVTPEYMAPEVLIIMDYVGVGNHS